MRVFDGGKKFVKLYEILQPENVPPSEARNLLALLKSGEYTALEARYEYAVWRVWKTSSGNRAHEDGYKFSGEFQSGVQRHSGMSVRNFDKFLYNRRKFAILNIRGYLHDGKFYDGSRLFEEEHITRGRDEDEDEDEARGR